MILELIKLAQMGSNPSREEIADALSDLAGQLSKGEVGQLEAGEALELMVRVLRGTLKVAASNKRAASSRPWAAAGETAERRRQAIIQAARKRMRGERVICSEKAYVDQALREARLMTLLPSEVGQFGIRDVEELGGKGRRQVEWIRPGNED